MVEGTTMVFTLAIQLAYNRNEQTHRQLDIRNVHFACLQTSEDITQRFSKMNRLIRVIGTARDS